MRTVWTFPGQLTEYVGMSAGLLSSSQILARNFELASDLVGEDLARICAHGPEAMLHRDDIAALAVVTVGASSAAELSARGFRPDAILGYSLGLYTAAVAAGAIALEDALRIVLTIAGAGDRHFPPGRMTMGFVTGMRVAKLEAALAAPLAQGVLAITNVNTPAQVVLAGETSALVAALDAVRPEAMRCERLQISRPYHSPWMAPVAEAVRDLCEGMEVRVPRTSLHDHKDGVRIETAEALRARLSEQLLTRLDWPASVRRLYGVDARLFVEMPPGSSTTRMVRWIERDAAALAIDQATDCERFLADGPPAGLGGNAAVRERGTH